MNTTVIMILKHVTVDTNAISLLHLIHNDESLNVHTNEHEIKMTIKIVSECIFKSDMMVLIQNANQKRI